MVSDEALGRVHLNSFAPLGEEICRSHQHDWVVASRLAVDAWQHAAQWTLGAVDAFVRASGAPDGLVEATVTLLDWPITVAGGSLTNGQHRRCAMHVQGVQETVAVYS